MPATRGIKARVAKSKFAISVLVVLLGGIIIYELRTGLHLASLVNGPASAKQIFWEDQNIIEPVRGSSQEELLKQKASLNLEEDPVQRILLSIGSPPETNPENRPDQNIVDLKEDPVTPLLTWIASQQKSAEKRPDQHVIAVAGRSLQEELLKQEASPNLEEDRVQQVLTLIASQQSSAPEKRPDPEAVPQPETSLHVEHLAESVPQPETSLHKEHLAKSVPQPETSLHVEHPAESVPQPETSLHVEHPAESVPQPETALHGEHLSVSLQPNGTKCSSRREYFRSGMSEECKELWREDVFRKPLPSQFVFVHIPKAGTSFTTTLRNYLPQCRLKDVACPHEKVPDEELSCNGALTACNGHNPVEADNLEKVRRLNRLGGVAMVSMIRDPVRRIISAKNHDCHRHSGSAHFNKLKKPCEQYDYEGFVDLPYIQHCQTKMMHKFFCAQDILPTQISLNAAEYNLFSLDFFGLTDEWDRSIRMFHCQFGGDLRSSELMNTRPGDYGEGIENTTINYIRDVETLDSKLYEYAVDLFNKREECMKCPPGCV